MSDRPVFTGKISPYRREVLARLVAAGDRGLTIDDARNGHPNKLPWLIKVGLAEHCGWDGDLALYHATDAGRQALASLER